MRIAVFGMGYVGVVSSACLLRDGHEIRGVDSVAVKVRDMSRGCSPVQEEGVAEMLSEGHMAGRLEATCDPSEALRDSEMVWICVGTPSGPGGGIDLSSVETVIRQIGRALSNSSNRPLIVLRSTCLPGTTGEIVIPLFEKASGLRVGRDVHVIFHPEFLREGTAVQDFYHPAKIVIGEAHPSAGDRLMDLYKGYDAQVFRLQLNEAELVKYCDNLFHAVKITFANEMATVAKSLGVDARRVADVYCADTKLNISPLYMRPGFAFGGSCLPKDLRAIARLAEARILRLPMLKAVLTSNEEQIKDLVSRVVARNPSRVGMVGLAFKPGTDDVRESPYVKVAKTLIGEGVTLRIYDPAIQMDELIGSNREQAEKSLRHLGDLLVSSIEELAATDLIIVNHPIVEADHIRGWLKAGIVVLDLADIKNIDRHTKGYEGIYW
jgi:GDP-mannose 6-dehydrogenase